jgi:hypothetical protein
VNIIGERTSSGLGLYVGEGVEPTFLRNEQEITSTTGAGFLFVFKAQK